MNVTTDFIEAEANAAALEGKSLRAIRLGKNQYTQCKEAMFAVPEKTVAVYVGDQEEPTLSFWAEKASVSIRLMDQDNGVVLEVVNEDGTLETRTVL